LLLCFASLTVVAAGVATAGDYRTNERGLDRRNLDTATDACVDFYQYANGNWLALNPIPDEYSSWGISHEMYERNLALLRQIMEEAADANAPKGTNQQKVGDFWYTGMDTEKIESQGLAPLKADLERVEAIAGVEDVAAMVRDLHAEGVSVLFDQGIFQDLKNSEQYLYYAVQGGLGLPDRDYYTREDGESAKLRQQYVAHVSTMLQLMGRTEEQASRAATSILELETRLAKASLTNVELRDPANYYHIETLKSADEATPNFSWSRYFERLGLEGMESFSYAQPDFFAEMNALLATADLDTWKAYLQWNLINNFSPYLSEAFVDQDFDFYGKTLRGTEELQPRWKRVVARTSSSLGEALGQVYVEQAFPPQTKARADKMIEDLRSTVATRIQNLDWMTDETKAQALAKLAAFNSKIGYPDQWRDYAKLDLERQSYVANVRAADAFEMRRNLDKIGQPIDRDEWGMSPQTVNAYYSPVMNEIVFPAAIMQPPMFDGEADDAINYGGMGSVIGHEFMHGFDDKGSQFDAQGNMENWWTDEDRQHFDERTKILVDQFGGFVAVDDLHVNGELTLGENIGDLAGLTMAFYALQTALEGNNPGEIDGFTPEQRFFLSWAQGWRKSYRPEALKLQVNTDPHSPAKFRVNGPLANMPEFAAAFGCKEGDPMALPADRRAEIW
ncbi:MAG: M13 family metallopeptidase, partial [Thermoanaerobaculia bacterium]